MSLRSQVTPQYGIYMSHQGGHRKCKNVIREDLACMVEESKSIVSAKIISLSLSCIGFRWCKK